MPVIEWDKIKNSEKTKEAIKLLVSKVPLQQVQQDLGKQFYNMDAAIETLYYAAITGTNAILYGPGGFGKTEITKAFFGYFDIPMYTKVGYSGMDVEALLGIPNIKKLMDESEYEVAFEKTIFNNSGALILEEFLDVKPTVAAALKDIITEGGFRMGNQIVPSKVGPIVICSNKSPNEVSVNDSTAAFYKERFPLSRRVVWETYSAEDYYKLLQLKFPDAEHYDLRLMSELLGSENQAEVISPRTAINAMQLYLISEDKSMLTLKHMPVIDLSKLESILYLINSERLNDYLADTVSQLSSTISGLNIENATDAVTLECLINSVKDILSSDKIVGDKLLAKIAIFNEVADRKTSVINELKREIACKELREIEELRKPYETIQEYKVIAI